jgi:hypothetical protein
MAAGVLIDTSFLITLAGKDRPHCDIARRYWKYFLENGIPIFLSTIVVSEFQIRQQIPPDMLRRCVVLPFNWDHAVFAAKLDWTRTRPPGVERSALKDDVKIIAQAAVADAQFVITDDAASFYRYCTSFKEAGQIHFKTIKLEDGFDRAFFDPNGQRDLTDELSEEEDPQL